MCQTGTVPCRLASFRIIVVRRLCFVGVILRPLWRQLRKVFNRGRSRHEIILFWVCSPGCCLSALSAHVIRTGRQEKVCIGLQAFVTLHYINKPESVFFTWGQHRVWSTCILSSWPVPKRVTARPS